MKTMTIMAALAGMGAFAANADAQQYRGHRHGKHDRCTFCVEIGGRWETREEQVLVGYEDVVEYYTVMECREVPKRVEREITEWETREVWVNEPYTYTEVEYRRVRECRTETYIAGYDCHCQPIYRTRTVEVWVEKPFKVCRTGYRQVKKCERVPVKRTVCETVMVREEVAVRKCRTVKKPIYRTECRRVWVPNVVCIRT